MSSDRPPEPVLILGTGLMGASVGLALARAGVTAVLDDADPVALREAVARGAGRPWADGDPQPVLVVVAVPPRAAGAVMAAALTRWPDSTVTDVCSVKARPLADAAAAGGDPARTVGGHPMAGREVSGPGAARSDLFDDRLWVLTPTAEAAPERVAAVRALVVTCGALPVVLDPETHDRAVALTSHTPQVVASLLAARLASADPGDVAISGQGLRDVTRVAGSDPDLWTEILRANARPVADVLDALAADLARVREALRDLALGATGDAAVGVDPAGALTDVLRRGNAGRARVPDKHGGGPAREYASVPVLLPDRPGELARLFAAAGDAGINLEDVRIDHLIGRPIAVVDLLVVPAVAERLAETLRAAGWQLRG